MKPAWQSLAKRLEKEKSVKVFDIEGFYNDLYDERYRPAKGFPAIFFKPAGRDKNPIIFPAEKRTSQDFINWLLSITEKEGKKLNILPSDQINTTSTEKLNNYMESLFDQELGPLQPMKEKVLDILEKYTLEGGVGDGKTQEEIDQMLLDELEKKIGRMDGKSYVRRDEL